ncbi:MAG TPA: TonB-dependent receptor [Pyrinomonadaceae bacterium]|nr:TonB-dependent receptor [Pyrinomonadaceae bacterium]
MNQKRVNGGKVLHAIAVAFMCLICVLASAKFAVAQDAATGKVVGTIKDQGGANVSGAEVSLLHQQRAVVATTTSDANGSFTIGNVAPGYYEVKVLSAGFTEFRKAVAVTANATLELAVSLLVNQVTEEVTVTAEAGQVVDARSIDSRVNVIPERQILERAPEVVAQVVDEEPGVSLQRTSPSLSAVFVRGLTGRNVAVYVDGVRYTTSAQRGGVGTFFSLIEPSALETVEIVRGPASSQYGSDVLGGVVNFISHSPLHGGSEPEFHGTTNLFYSSPTDGFGGNARFTYGTKNHGVLLNLNGRRINRLRPGNGLDSHSATLRFLGVPSDFFGERLPDTAFTQYGGLLSAHLTLNENTQLIFSYARNQQDGARRYDQLLGGDGNLIADLRNLMTDLFYARLFRQHLGPFDNASFTFSFNGQREERINQGGQGNPTGAITSQRERTDVLGFNFFVDKRLGERNTILFGADVYRDHISAPAYTLDPVTRITTPSRPRIPNGAEYLSYGFFAQNVFTAIPDRLRISGALRYSAASYDSRAANAPIGPSGRPLFPDDSARFGAFSGRIGAVVHLGYGFDIAGKYTRGFRAPNTTDLGILGLVGSGFEVDSQTASSRGGFIGTTAGGDAVTTGIPAAPLGPEISDSFDLTLRYKSSRFSAEITGFTNKLNDVYFDQALILPPGAVGTFLGSEPIIFQDATRGWISVGVAPTTPVLVRVNYDDARFNGVEANAEALLSKQLTANANFTYIRAHSLLNGLPPNIEGGVPPATTFLSLRYQPRSRFYIEGYSTIAAEQNRLSSLDLGDRRTGAARSRTNIQSFFRRGACVRGLTTPGGGGCGTAGGILVPTGETLAQVQDRLLPIGATINGVFIANNDTLVPLYTSVAGYGLIGVRGAYQFDDHSEVFVDFENIGDRFHRGISWGVDGAGRGVTVRYRYKF